MIIARQSETKKIFSVDVNPIAVQYMRENIKLNKVEGRIVAVLGDARVVIEDRLQNIADRVLMPLPQKAYEYLDYALMALKPTGKWIHYYDFAHARKTEDPVEKVKTKVSEKLRKIDLDFEMPFQGIVREVGPNWFQVVIDVVVNH